MDLRASLLGSERGAALAVVVTFLAAGFAVLLRPPVELPLSTASLGRLGVVLAFALPAILVGAYGGGLLLAWVTMGVPTGLLWWLSPGPAGALIVSPTTWDRSVATLEVAVSVALVVGTLGFAVGRLLGAAWARRNGVPA